MELRSSPQLAVRKSKPLSNQRVDALQTGFYSCAETIGPGNSAQSLILIWDLTLWSNALSGSPPIYTK